MVNGLRLETDDGEQHIVGPSSLIIFADETGSDHLTDPAYPVFGLGCCSLLAKNHQQSISRPWSELKRRIFGEERHPFHAADLPKLQPEDVSQLARYLRHAPFDRCALALTKKTKTDVGPWVLAVRYMIQSVVMLAEVGTYTDIVVMAERGQEKKWRQAVGGWSTNVPATVQFLAKNPVNYGIELADLIATMCGRQARYAHGYGSCPNSEILNSIFSPKPPGRAKAIIVDSTKRSEGRP